MKSMKRKLAVVGVFTALAMAVSTASAASDAESAATQAQAKPAMKKIDGPQFDANGALARAQAKFARAARIVDKYKGEIKASGDAWRFEMIASLMKGSEANFELVEGASSYSEAASVAKRISMITPQALGDTTTDLVYVPMAAPCRILDTRVGGSAIPANSARTYHYTAINTGSGPCSITPQIPGVSDDPAAVAVMAAVDQSSVLGFPVGSYFQIYPETSTPPTPGSTSFMNFGPGTVVANAGVISINQATGKFTVISNAPTNQIIDVYGVFIEPQPTALECTDVPGAAITLDSTDRQKFAFAPACSTGYTRTAIWGNSNGDYALLVTRLSMDSAIIFYYGGSGTVTPFVNSRCCRIPGRN